MNPADTILYIAIGLLVIFILGIIYLEFRDDIFGGSQGHV